LFTNAGHYLAHTFILIFPSIATPLSRELGLPFEEVLKVSFLMYLLYGLGSLPCGFISDRLQPKSSLLIYFAGIGVSGILIFFCRTRTHLLLSLMLLGMFLSIHHPAATGLLSKSIKNRGMALGLNGMFGSIGIASAPFLAGMINFFAGWRYVYLLLSIVSVFFGILLSSMKLNIEAVGEKAGLDHPAKKAEMKLLYFLILCVSFCLAGFVYRGQSLVLPTYFEHNIKFLNNFISSMPSMNMKLEGTKTLSATLLTSMVYLISIGGQIAGGKIADRFDLRFSYFIIFACSLPFLVMMYFFRNVPLFIASIFFILFSIGMQPVENSLIARFTPSKWRNTSFGIKFILTFGISSFVIYPIGYFQVHFSLASVFLLFSLLIAVLVMNNLILILVTRGVSLKN
jgi:MFS family permease